MHVGYSSSWAALTWGHQGVQKGSWYCKGVRQHFTTVDVFSPPQSASKAQPCPLAIDVHYSFDMAQHPLQLGPMYFLTPRNLECAVRPEEVRKHHVHFIIADSANLVSIHFCIDQEGACSVLNLSFFAGCWERVTYIVFVGSVNSSLFDKCAA